MHDNSTLYELEPLLAGGTKKLSSLEGLPPAIPELPNPHAIMRSLGLRARKSLGQNFLTRSEILRDIVYIAGIGPNDTVLEIGPGLGGLTVELIRAGARVIALEKDRNLVQHLRQTFGARFNLTVVEADALIYDLLEFQRYGALRVVANLPYNVATPIIFRLLEGELPFLDLHVMVQKEVADRMAARPSTSSYGALSVRLQYLAEVSFQRDVPRQAFFPVPNVDSGIVRIQPRKTVPFDAGNKTTLDTLIRLAFGERRKTLRNALSAGVFSKGDVEEALRSVGIDPMRRGETLSLQEFCRLSLAVTTMMQPT